MAPIKRIFCPVDFFPASLNAVDYAIALARNYDAKVHILHVVTPFLPAAYDAAIPLESIVETLTAAAEKNLEKLLRRLKPQGVPVESTVRAGDVDLQIQAFVEQRKPDLIVMGTHGRHGLEKWFLGSHTERLLRRANVPMLTIGHKKVKVASPAIKRVLVTTDFSDGTADALRYAFSVAQEYQAKVTLLHVLDDISADLSGKYRDPLIKSIREKLEDLIPADVRARCDVTTRVETGVPVRRILDVIKKDKVDLVVMNLHGTGILDRALLGSTAERIVRSASAPVLAIPPMGVRKDKRKTPAKAA